MKRQPGHSAGSRTLRDMSLRPKSLIFLSVVLVAGVLGGMAAYQVVQASSPEPTPRESLIVDSADDGTGQAAEKKARNGRPAGFAPCRKPARLEGRKCVTEVVRTVTLPGQSAVAVAPPPAPASAPAPAPSSSSSQSGQSHHHGGDDDHGHHGGEGEDGHHGDDDDDDHSGHGHGGDDGDDDGDDDRDDDHSGHGHGGDDDEDDDHHGEDD